MPKERIAYIDFMKGLCIMLIVMGHVNDFSFDAILPNLNFALRSFRIPMYFFLSGLFFKTYSGFNEFLRKKVNNLIVTLLFFHFLCCLLWVPLLYLTHHYLPEIDLQFPLSYAIPSFHRRFWFSATALWFLVALFGVNMLYYLFQRYMNFAGVVAVVAVCSVIGFALMKHSIKLPLELDIALVGLPYFVLGSAVKRFGLMEPSRYDKFGFLVILPCIWIIYRFSGDIDLLHQVVPNYLQLYLIPFVAILSLFWLCKNLSYVPLVCHYGRYSIILLGTHQMLIAYVWLALIGFSHLQPSVIPIVTIVLVFALELPVIHLLVKYFPRFTAQQEFFKPGWTI